MVGRSSRWSGNWKSAPPGNLANGLPLLCRRASSARRRNDQRRHLRVLGAEPKPQLTAFGMLAILGARLQLSDMDLHAVKAKGAVRVGRGAPQLLVIDEIALEEDDRGARHRSARAVAYLAFDDAAVVEGDIDVPAGDKDCDGQRHRDEAMAEDASPAHPLVAPEVRPRMNSFCAIRKMVRPGTSTRTTKAKSAPVVSSMTERKRARPSGKVCISDVRITISGHRKAFHDQMKVRMTLVAIADFDSGNMMRTMIRHSLKPSTRAASISDLGTASKLALKMKMQMIVDSRGSAMPR